MSTYTQIKTKPWVVAGVTLIVMGFVSLFLIGIGFFMEVSIVVGLEILLLSISLHFISRSKSIKLLGLSLITFSFLYLLIHSDFFIYLFRFQELFEYDSLIIKWLIGKLVAVIGAVLIMIHGIRLIVNWNSIDFHSHINSNYFRVVLSMIIILMILEIPIYGLHGDFGGVIHGHSIWNSWFHMH